MEIKKNPKGLFWSVKLSTNSIGEGFTEYNTELISDIDIDKPFTIDEYYEIVDNRKFGSSESLNFVPLLPILVRNSKDIFEPKRNSYTRKDLIQVRFFVFNEGTVVNREKVSMIRILIT